MKLYELKKDIQTPNKYFRAGEIKTQETWEELFPGAFLFNSNEWFIDVVDTPEIEQKIPDIVRDVFKEYGLHSISYKMAAIECIKRYAKKVSPPEPPESRKLTILG